MIGYLSIVLRALEIYSSSFDINNIGFYTIRANLKYTKNNTLGVIKSNASKSINLFRSREKVIATSFPIYEILKNVICIELTY